MNYEEFCEYLVESEEDFFNNGIKEKEDVAIINLYFQYKQLEEIKKLNKNFEKFIEILKPVGGK